MKSFLAAAALWAVAAAPILTAQPPDTFEVASIKLGDPLSSGTSFSLQPGASLKVENASLKSLIQYAYDLRDFQLSGVSGWMTSERYTILAKGAGGGADYRSMNDAQRKAAFALVRKRLQRLLAEPFQLVVHLETKQLPVYALVLAKNGHKLKPNTSPDGAIQGMTTGRAIFKGERASMEGIVQGLSGITGRPVRDETGLQGYLDFEMKWTPDAAAAPDSGEARPPETVGPTLFTALQEQLGLKLESRRGPVEILVVDHAERPSEN
jgi:uncharacterized protein (TIGR03435 family)